MTTLQRDVLTFWRNAVDKVRHPDTALVVPVDELRELVTLAEQGKRRTRTKTGRTQKPETVL